MFSKALVPLIALSLMLAVAGMPALAQTPSQESLDANPQTRLDVTADHRKFQRLSREFASGPEVTEACIHCHTEAARQVHNSIHWTWEYDQPETGQRLGKRFVLNNFCLGIAGSEQRCASCHVGYGFDGPDFDFTAENRVDCLVCHDNTGTYSKFPTAAGHPLYEDTMFRGRMVEAPDLNHIARHVGKTTRTTCGSCHFEGGGGDAVKHGDLDSSLIDPPFFVDVHMSPEGLDFSCSTCHEFSGHVQEGSRYHKKTHSGEVTVPGRVNERPGCQSCHGAEPHSAGIHDKLNQHSQFIACQTCHIPEMARGGLATKTLWDWSTAGELDAEGRPVVRRDGNNYVTYDGMKGDFAWAENYPPIYRWFDGNMSYTLLEDPIDPSQVVDINTPQGEPWGPGALIWPFKLVDGRQPYDVVHQRLLVPHLFGQDEYAYWRNYDWDRALESGMRQANLSGQTSAEYSGQYGFVNTQMFWSVNHMVAPADEALSCASCHTTGGRLEGLPGVYIPGRDRHSVIELVGWVAVLATLLSVLAHGGLRVFLARRRRSGDEA
ncbi:octaheme c-type cytochrome, tetrathionate reductase family [Ectothiorhodosinus mongolicus]|uniref:Octaheme c-type cytochrome, tetrathionate reductase family n=1 Tax=Ectothiorhodosinus mongolicus TaxID=233100 RepID=A0A1R3VY71_9GAMM|nr:tetrathionate reductase family octaheme c-type cytochrome [Ectothiorhodosinus mongolicus]SIT70156.1 octaheme c-type cytochrome, tetrathionate reductase family [Ectothiorhodosinus mongolicus]